MVAYLTDVTLFWAVSLLLYLTLFRKTTFHSANRAMLLGTLLAGLLLPLWPQSLPETIVAVPHYYELPVTRISTAKAQMVAQVTSHAQPAFTLSIGLLYGIGCAVAALFYLRGVVRLFRLTRRARKQSLSGKTFYETGASHTPFSFFGKTFITRADRYSPTDLSLILQHESRHSAYRHSVDVLLLAGLRIAFWFHPLVYVYDYLLKQLHEFQADAFARPEPQAYGFLLLQEGTANSFPLVHSFSRSPLKTRILMLTRTSTPALLKLQYLLLIPVLLLAFEACQKKDVSGSRLKSMSFPGDSVFYFRGNEFVREGGTSIGRLDSGGKVTLYGTIKKMNDEPVYLTKEVDVPARYNGPAKSAFDELCARILPNLQLLPDGNYYLMIGIMAEGGEIISKEGRLEFYGESLIGTNFYNGNGPLPKEVPELSEPEKRPVLKAINKAMEEGFSFSPALKNGKPVNSLMDHSIFTATPKPVKITVQNGEVTIGQDVAQGPPENVDREMDKVAEAVKKKIVAAKKIAEQQAAQQIFQHARQYILDVEAAKLKAKQAEAMIRESQATSRKAQQYLKEKQVAIFQQLQTANQQLIQAQVQLIR